ncbi:LPS translocon maturation chaperone LptM [Caballeronia humi]|jgi:predicted small lipoprotein YifL|uniref:Lipoprotein n=1 Tax=Caballeronia humi TaxID=326474 RepID=A0A158HQ93_9BURK|nr:lipoprotein [Caballeronia humi]SAL46476.1 putative lipoprotein [Caballeronia humi]
MRVVFRMSAIVAALAVSAVTVGALGGCGQRGPLYLPATPPLPQRPASLQETPPPDAASGDESTVPDTSGQPLSLSPDTDLKSNAAAPKAASSAD